MMRMAHSVPTRQSLSCQWIDAPAWDVIVRRNRRQSGLWSCHTASARASQPVSNRPSRFGCFNPFMNTPRFSVRPRRGAGFTLIELLVVIAIIAILAGLLLPVLAQIRLKVKVKQAKMDASQIAAAIKQYEASYDRYPATKEVEAAAGANKEDFSFADGGLGKTIPPYGLRNNREVMEILLDIDHPNGFNQGHRRNPKQIKMLDAKQNTGTGPGISVNDWTFRDPWGQPYVITLDMNEDGKCWDVMYSKDAVSGTGGQLGAPGLMGLVRAAKPDGTLVYELNNSVMVWSFGPDASYDLNTRANVGVNKDNVLGW